MSLLKVPVADPADQGAPSTQEVSLVADPSKNQKQLTRITQTAGVREVISVEMNIPVIKASEFGTVFALPPAGILYQFLDSDNGNTLSTINNIGTVTPIGLGTTTTVTNLTVKSTANLQGLVQMGENGNVAARKIFMDDNGQSSIEFDPTTGRLNIGTKAGATFDTIIKGQSLILAELPTDLIGMFGTPAVAQGTVSLAAPVLLADCILQIEQIKAALGQTTGIGAFKLA